nr:unnamed protein product [Callosobruchus chinensis]
MQSRERQFASSMI